MSSRDIFYQSHDHIDLVLASAGKMCSHSNPIAGIILAADEGLESLVMRLPEGRRRLHGFKVSSKPPYLVQVPVSKESASPLAGNMAKAFLWPVENSNLFIMLAMKDDFSSLLETFRYYLSTDISSVFLQGDDFYKAFHSITTRTVRSQIYITGYTSNVLSDAGKNLKTRREWLTTPKEYASFFSDLDGENQWIRSIWFSAKGFNPASESERVITTKGRIKRDLSFTCEQGFELFFKTFVAAFLDQVMQSRAIFIDRGVLDSPTQAARPLEITYSSQIFRNKEQNRRLINVLRDLPNSAIAVFHGNPYLHASLVDYATDSSYTLWITDNSSIKIVPELRATPGSLERLCNYITEQFAGGVISESQEN